MKPIYMKCPNCNADLSFDRGQQFYFCSYCGTKIIADDNTTTTNINIKYDQNITQRNIDEAELKRIEYQHELEKAKMQQRAEAEAAQLQWRIHQEDLLQSKMQQHKRAATIWKLCLFLYLFAIIAIPVVMAEHNLTSHTGYSVWLGTIIFGPILLIIFRPRKPKK